MVTHCDYRQKGLAKAILKFSLDYAWTNGCTEVMLLSGNDLKEAHKLYESMGFDQHQRKGFIIFKPK
jgi:GNAT superfamily N-acetyltransferase